MVSGRRENCRSTLPWHHTPPRLPSPARHTLSQSPPQSQCPWFQCPRWCRCLSLPDPQPLLSFQSQRPLQDSAFLLFQSTALKIITTMVCCTFLDSGAIHVPPSAHRLSRVATWSVLPQRRDSTLSLKPDYPPHLLPGEQDLEVSLITSRPWAPWTLGRHLYFSLCQAIPSTKLLNIKQSARHLLSSSKHLSTVNIKTFTKEGSPFDLNMLPEWCPGGDHSYEWRSGLLLTTEA